MVSDRLADFSLCRRLEKMRKEGGREGRQKVAIAARRLLGLSKEIEGVEGAEKVRLAAPSGLLPPDLIDLLRRLARQSSGIASGSRRTCCASSTGTIGKATRRRWLFVLLSHFNLRCQSLTHHASQHCAQTLQEFNGGQSCIQIYVNQHDFFISKERVQEAAGGLVGGAMYILCLTFSSPARLTLYRTAQLGVTPRSRLERAERRAGPGEPVRGDPRHGRPGGTDRHGRLPKSCRRHAGLPAARLCASGGLARSAHPHFSLPMSRIC